MKHLRPASLPLLPLLPLLLTLGGCAVGPDYQRPEAAVPEQFRFAPPQAGPAGDSSPQTSDRLANLAWWEEFREPVLNQLVAEALANNRDLQAAAARVEEAAGAFSSTRSQLFPQLGSNLQGQRQRSSGASTAVYGRPDGMVGESYAASLNVSWELDLFGRLRRSSEAARAELLASEEARRAVALSLAASVAQGYVGLLDYDQQLAVARHTLKSRQDALKLFELRFAGGVISELELAQARAELETAQSAVPRLEQAVAQQEHALSRLLGRLPGPIPRGRPLAQLDAPLPPLGLPSALLERRPDIRQAEQMLIAANARIGVAKAAYFPRISLTGLLGSLSPSWGDLFTGPMKTWSYGAGASLPIFTAGGLAGQLLGAEARQQEALAQYRGSIETGFREVADALVASEKTKEQAASLGRQVLAYADYARIARLRYEGGYSSYLEVLNAEDRLFSAELNFSQAQGQALIAAISLYKALGGGWEALETPASGLPPEKEVGTAQAD